MTEEDWELSQSGGEVSQLMRRIQQLRGEVEGIRKESIRVFREKIEEEIHHAADNGHLITEGQGIEGPTPGVRVQFLEAALDGAERQLLVNCEHPRSRIKFDGGRTAVVCNVCDTIVTYVVLS